MLQEWLIKPHVLLYVDMKTSYSAREIEFLKTLPKHYTDRLIIKECPLGEYERENKYLPYRNLILGTLAMQYGQHVYFGFNDCDDAPDKDKTFLNRTTKLFEHLNKNCIYDMGWETDNFGFSAPFKNYSKTEMVRICLDEGMPVDLIQNIRSCYSGTSEKGCGECYVCLNKAVALLNNGIYDPKVFDHEFTIEDFDNRIKFIEEGPYEYKTKYYQEVKRARKHLLKLQK